MLSQTANTSLIFCSAIITLRLLRLLIFAMFWNVTAVAAGERPKDGSSKSNNFGDLVKAIAIASSCFSPPESKPAL